MYCISPITIKNPKTKQPQHVPCGRCHYCISNKRKEWSIRLKHEFQSATKASFVTLTYNDFHVPIRQAPVGDDENMIYEYQVLDKEDLQKYFKRLRKDYTQCQNRIQYKHKDGKVSRLVKCGVCVKCRNELRYYAVGEYGERSQRPHYHILFFGIGRNESQLLTEKWGKGHIRIDDMNEATINYTTKYMFKKGKWDNYMPEKPFSLMSRKPPIGHKWLKANRKGKKRALDATVLDNGYKNRMPRSYREKIFNNFEKKYIAKRSEKMAEKQSDREYKKYGIGYAKLRQERYKNYGQMIEKRKSKEKL